MWGGAGTGALREAGRAVMRQRCRNRLPGGKLGAATCEGGCGPSRARFGDHRGVGRAAGSPVLPACCLLDRRPSPHRREMGPIMAGMGYWRRQVEHCPEEGLAPRRTEEVECLAASEGARFGDYRRAGRLRRCLSLAAYRLLRRLSPSSLCGSGPIMAGYWRSLMEHCPEGGLVVRRAEEGMRSRSGGGFGDHRGAAGLRLVCLCRRAVLLSVHRRCAGPKRS